MRLASVTVAAVVATLVAVSPAGAATIAVNTTVDVSSNNDALCSLREAVTAAQKNDINPNNCTDGDEDVIDKISLDASGTYQLGGAVEDNNVSGDLDFSTNDAGVEIEGDLGFLGFPLDMIDGGGDDRVLHFRVPFQTAIIDGVQIQDGHAQDDSGGGGIRSTDDISVTVEGGSVITDNLAEGSGGGILSWGPLLVRDSVVSGNTARSGGGIGESGSITIERSIVSENVATNEEDGDVDGLSGAGLDIGGGVAAGARITDSTISDNQIVFDDPADVANGGGIETSVGMVMRGTTVSGNKVVGTGIFTHGAGVVTVADFSDGGFIAVNSTISANDGGATGSEGGGLWTADGSPAVLIHTTIKGNTANTGPGIFNNGAGVVQLRGTLVDQGSNACSGTITANAYNADAGTSCVGPQGDTDRALADLFIGGFGFNGGLTPTWIIGPTSDAVDLVPGPACTEIGVTPLTADQRGAERPTGAGCDAGAYERVTCQGAVPTRLGGPGDDSINGTAGADVIVGSAGDDTLAGAGGDDRICGGSGGDQIGGGAGVDWLEGQAGGDTLLAKDGLADLRVDCGAGVDAFSADPGLDSPIDCETDLDAPPPAGPGTDPLAPNPAAPKKCKRKRGKGKRSAEAAKKRKKKCRRKKGKR